MEDLRVTFRDEFPFRKGPIRSNPDTHQIFVRASQGLAIREVSDTLVFFPTCGETSDHERKPVDRTCIFR